jgi:hypothetical protein
MVLSITPKKSYNTVGSALMRKIFSIRLPNGIKPLGESKFIIDAFSLAEAIAICARFRYFYPFP